MERKIAKEMEKGEIFGDGVDWSGQGIEDRKNPDNLSIQKKNHKHKTKQISNLKV